MAYVSAGFQNSCCAREHVHHAIFLNITAVFNYDLTPVATQNSSRTDVHIFADNYITCNIGLWMHETCWFDNWDKSVK